MRANPRLSAIDVPTTALAVVSLGAAAIHFAVMPAHFKEWWLFGLFFAGLGWFQALWSVGYLLVPARQLAWLAIAVNSATLLLWIWTRTLGLPIGPDSWVPEAVGVPDILAGILELWLVIGLVRASGSPLPAMSMDIEWLRAALSILLVAGIVAAATSAAMALGGM